MNALVEHHALGSASGSTRGRGRPAPWWGMMLAIATEATLFAGLLSSYFYLRSTSEQWPLEGLRRPDLMPVTAYSVVLIASSIPVYLSERAVRRDHIGRTRLYLGLAFVMGAVFLYHAVRELARSEFGVDENAYASIFLITVGFHALHLTVGLVMSAGVQVKAATGRIRADRHLTLKMFSMYWHFVDAVWVAVFASLYLSVR